MTIGSILLGLALFVLAGLFIARPLFNSDRRSNRKPTTRQSLQLQKEAVLTEIANLDFDYETGNLPEEEYQQQRQNLMADATAILKQLDVLDEGAPVSEPVLAPQSTGPEPVVDDEIEAAIARRRTKPVQAAQAPADGSEAKTANGQSAICPQCGQATDPDDKFCANCGHELLIAQRV
jgi:hypothetical protein